MARGAADASYMAAAIGLGDRNVGLTRANPSVGALVVREGTVVGAGATQPGGRVHAEAVALEQAGEAARGATLYVTLEPCSWRSAGGTPCLERVIDAGIARVVVGTDDPNHRIAGGSLDALGDHGIDWDYCLPDLGRCRVFPGHLAYYRLGRPYVTVKQALSSDGRIAGAGHVPIAITGPAANAQVHLMRAQADVILVGAGTVRADDPMLTCRLPGLHDRSPIRVVLDDRLTITPTSRLVRTARQVPTWVMHRAGVDDGRLEILREAGVRLFSHDGGLGDIFGMLAREDVRTVLAEAGPGLARRLHDDGLVDIYTVYRSPITIGSDGVPPMRGADLGAILARTYRPFHRHRHGVDTRIDYERS